MARFFKKIAKKIKKFSRSKLGKVLKVGAAVGLGVVGAGAAVKGIKALKNAKKLKGLASRAKSVVKVGKGLGAGRGKATTKEKKALFGNGVSRLAKRLDRKANRKAKRLLKKQGKLDAKKQQLQANIESAQNSLAGGEFHPEEDKDFIEEQKEKLKKIKEDILGDDDEDKPANDDKGDSDSSSDNKEAGMSNGAKVGVGLGLAAGGLLLASLLKK